MRGASPFQGLDCYMAARRGLVCPLLYCHMELAGEPDPARLARAVAGCAEYVPELLWGCDFARGRFADRGLEPWDVLRAGPGAEVWALENGPQFRLVLRGRRLTAGVSHVLSDGAGLLQLLYLLAAIYNGSVPPAGLSNRRSPAPLLAGNRAGRSTAAERRACRASVPAGRVEAAPGPYRCLRCVLPAEETADLRAQARARGATFNDVLLTACARVAARGGRAALPCPADLRRFGGEAGLTVANLTGAYLLGAELRPGEPFSDTLARIGAEMGRQKARRRCFAGVALLHGASRILPAPLLGPACRAGRRQYPFSYSNLGEIDAGRLQFAGCPAADCFFTGAYRTGPDLQLNASTFRGACTLSCALGGPEARDAEARRILAGVGRELAAWRATSAPGVRCPPPGG